MRVDPALTWPLAAAGPTFHFQGWPEVLQVFLAPVLSWAPREGCDRSPPVVLRYRPWRGGFPPVDPGGWVWAPRGAVAGLAGAVSVVVGPESAEVRVGSLSPRQEAELVWRVVPAVLGELALARGWLLLHAAGVGWRGGGLLLPGPSGVGKTTIYQAAAAMGWPVLADDLVWVQPRPAGRPRLVGFPRGGWTTVLAPPTAREVELAAVVLPRVGEDAQRRVIPVHPRDAVMALWRQRVGLGGAGRGASFSLLAQLVSQTPVFSWVRPRLAVDPCYRCAPWVTLGEADVGR